MCTNERSRVKYNTITNLILSLGKCLQLVGVKAGDSRDSFGRGRFIPFSFKQRMFFEGRDPNF